MEQTLAAVWSRCVRGKAYILSLSIPAAILLVSYMIFGVYPFGGRSVLALDMNAQYVYYYEYMYDVFAGKESLFYSWSGTLSGEFFGLFAYYLASPFNLIVWLFPRTCVTEGIMTMQLAKCAAVGLTSAVMFKKHRGFSDFTTIVFSVMFALSGFFTAHTLNPMWLDGLIALPLVITGVELIFERRAFLPYVLSLVYSFITNFYIGYMIGIFSAVYFLYCFLSGKAATKTLREAADSIIIYGAASVSAILSSCWIIIPVYKSLAMGKFDYTEPDYTPAENFNMADIFIKLFPGTYDTLRPEGLPMLYCGTTALIFAAAYFTMRSIPARRRIAGGFLLGILALSMYIKPVDMFWHGGQVPVWMPFRYAFIVAFLLIMFGAEAFENIKSVRSRTLCSIFLLLLGVLLFSDYYEGNERFDTNLIIVIPLIALAAAAAVAAAYKKRAGARGMSMLLACAVCVELLINTVVTLFKINKDVYYSTRDSYRNDIPYARDVADRVKELDDGFYRMEKTFHRCVNDNMALGMYGFSHSTSTFNGKAIALLKTLGYGARGHYSRYDGATLLSDDIFGVKYVLSKNRLLSQYTDTVSVENNSDITAYVNEDALGFAYLGDKGLIGGRLEGESPFEIQNLLASQLSGRKEEIFVPIYDLVFDSKNINIGTTTDAHSSYKKRNTNEGAYISYTVTMPLKGAAYVYFPTDYERECFLSVNDEYIKNYFENENHCIAYLGSYGENESFDVRLSLTKDSLYFKEAQFFCIDEEKLAGFIGEMNAKNPQTAVTRTGTASLSIEVYAEEDCALFTSIPFEEGWAAKIDGAPAQPLSTANDTLLCLEIPRGKHTVELEFFTAGMRPGLLFTASGIILLAVMILFEIWKRRSASESPDGEAPP